MHTQHHRAFAVWLAALLPALSLAATIQGVVWNDLNRDGVRTEVDARFAGATVLLFGVGLTTNQFIAVTDLDGNYSFAGMPVGQYQLYVTVSSLFGITSPRAGTNTTIDSDLVLYSYFPPTAGATDEFSYSGDPIDHLDAGFTSFLPDMASVAQAGDAGPGQSLYVTNGSLVTFTYAISNRGDTALSNVSVIDDQVESVIGALDCPTILSPGEYVVFTNKRIMTASITSEVEFISGAVNPITCSLLESEPSFSITQTVVVVVSDTDNTDGDDFTDWEEQIAQTDATNAASSWAVMMLDGEFPAFIIPSSSIERVYGIYAVTNLLDAVSPWASSGPEQTGTGAAISFPMTNGSPGAMYRAGVRLP